MVAIFGRKYIQIRLVRSSFLIKHLTLVYIDFIIVSPRLNNSGLLEEQISIVMSATSLCILRAKFVFTRSKALLSFTQIFYLDIYKLLIEYVS